MSDQTVEGSSSKGERREVPEWAAGDSLMEWYSMEVWGRRVDSDDALFEIMNLQVFQAGLTFRMVLSRRDAFRKAFHGWRIDKVAGDGPQDIQRLTEDASIIRNRRKIEACISNASVIEDIQAQHGSFCAWFYDVLEGDDLVALQQTLRKTFKFMGPRSPVCG